MINNLISVEFCHALSLAMIHSLWQGIAVVFILWMLDFFHLVRQPKNNYALHYFFMLLLLAGFIINILFGIQDINTTNSMNEFSPTFANSPGNNLSSAISGFITDWQYWLGISWFMGFLFFSLRSIWGTVQVYNLKSISKPVNNEWVVKVKEMSRKLNYQGKVQLLSTQQLFMPIVVGVVRPCIIFPSSFFTHLSQKQIESVLIHEIVHILRNDFLLNTIQSIVESILFFNPATWYINYNIRKYREFICDDQVKSQVPDLHSYLEALYKIASYSLKSPPMAQALFTNKSILIMRVKRMLGKKGFEYQMKPVFTMILGALFIFSAFSFNLAEEETNKHSVLLKSVNLPTPLIQTEILHLSTRTPQIEPIPTIKQKRSLKLLTSSNLKPELVTLDTVPMNERIKELEALIEVKSKELEELSQKLSFDIQSSMEERSKEMEELSRQLQEKMESRMKAIDQTGMSEDLQQKMEKMTAALNEKMQERTQQIQSMMESEEMQKYQQEMQVLTEKLAQQAADNEGVKSEEMKQTQQELKEIGRKMREQARQLRDQQRELRNDPEIKQMKEKMRAARDEYRDQMKELRDPMRDEEMRAIKESMRNLQREIRDSSRAVNMETKQALREKSREIKELSRELKEEYKKLEKKEKKK